jgi:ABC-type transport system involved in multi-copper enzyme maturation permease subunit
MNLLRRTSGWLRRRLAWSNSRRSWYERLGVLALAALAAGAWWFSRGLGLESRLVLLAAWLLLLALMLRRGLIKLFGPVFFFELLRRCRKRVHLVRTLYALALLASIAYVHVVQDEVGRYSGDNTKAQAEVAFTAFVVFFGVELALVGFLTPVFVGGCIAEEKERRTLEYILATDLHSREIVLGKLAGRLADIILIFLTGLPVLALLQFLGGIPPDLLLVSFAITLLTLGSVAVVSLWHSVMLRRVRDAIVLTFVSMLAYLLLSGAAQGLRAWDAWTTWKVNVGRWTIDGTDLTDAIGAGNPFVHAGTIAHHMETRDNYLDVVPDILTEYAVFHGLVMAAGLGWAMLRLRPVAIAQSTGEARRRRGKRRLPAIGRFPMIWKELHAEGRLRLHWLLRIVFVFIAIGSFVPAILITAQNFDSLLAGTFYPPFDPFERYASEMNGWVRVVSPIVGTLLLLAVAVRAAGSVTGERSRQTFDDLLTSPLSNCEILYAKWLGSILSVRVGWLWLGVVFVLGFLSGGLSLLGIFFFILAWFSFACLAASVGLYCSVARRNTLRATVATLVLTLFLFGGHWVVSALACFLPLSLATRGAGDGSLVEWLLAIEMGFTPPVLFAAAPMQDLKEFQGLPPEAAKFIFFALVGCLVSFGLSFWLRHLALEKFEVVFSRGDVRCPEISVASKTTALNAAPGTS